jgi:hypothetical protein
MNHRIVSGVITFVVLFFVTLALGFGQGARPRALAGAVRPGRPAAIPHALGAEYATCADCHTIGGAALALPATHRSFQAKGCHLCHAGSSR